MLRTVFIIVLTLATVHAQELLHQDFEDRIPGQMARGWSFSWGNHDDDLLLVTNLESVSGKQSFLLDRASGMNKEQWGACTSLPSPDDGWLALSFCFQVEGKGHDTRFGIELRNGTKRALSLRFAYHELSVYTNMPSPPKHLQGGKLGAYAPGQWYKLQLWLPTAVQDTPGARVQLKRIAKSGAESVGTPVEVACLMARKPGALLMLNTSPNHRNFRLYLDDIVCEHVAALP